MDKDMHPVAREDLTRFISYRWDEMLIMKLMRLKHGVELTKEDVRALRQARGIPLEY